MVCMILGVQEPDRSVGQKTERAKLRRGSRVSQGNVRALGS